MRELKRRRVSEEIKSGNSVQDLWNQFLNDLRNDSSYEELDVAKYFKVFARKDSRCIITMKVISALGLWKVVFQDVDGQTKIFLVGDKDQYDEMVDYWFNRF